MITTGSSVLHAPERERCVLVCFKLADESVCELNESPSPLGYGYVVWQKTDLKHIISFTELRVCYSRFFPPFTHSVFLALRGPLLAVKMSLPLPHCYQDAQICILQHQAFTFSLQFISFFFLPPLHISAKTLGIHLFPLKKAHFICLLFFPKPLYSPYLNPSRHASCSL